MNLGTYVIDLEKLLKDCGYTAMTKDGSTISLPLGPDGYKLSNAKAWRNNIKAASVGRNSCIYISGSSFFSWAPGQEAGITNLLVKRITSSSDLITIYFEIGGKTATNYVLSISNIGISIT